MRVMVLGLLMLAYMGCSQLAFKEPKEERLKQKKVFSCEEKAKSKSLLEIEQHYRCRSK